MSTDRTSEFFSIARSLPAPVPQSSSSASSKPKSTTAYSELRSFHQTASGISKDIAATSALLAELTNLVRHSQSTVFDQNNNGSQTAINNLVVRIKGNIENLNHRLDQAAAVMASHKRQSQAGQEALNVVQGLQTEFAQTAAGFKDILQVRTESMKESDRLQKQVYGDDVDDDNPIPNLSLAPPPVFGNASSSPNNAFPTLDLTSSLMPAGEDTGPSYLPRPHGISSSSGGGMRHRHGHGGGYSGAYAALEMTNDDEMPLTPFDIEQMEAANGQQSLQLIPDQDYLQQRADAMSTVETNIVELGTIFNKLATMVAEHREMVQRVEDNVDDANANINLSLNVLTDTLTSLRTNRRLALRVFSVLVVFILSFIIFFA